MYAEEMACFVGMGAKVGREWIQIIGKDTDRAREGSRQCRGQHLNLQLCSVTQIFQGSFQSLPHFKARFFLLKAAAVFFKVIYRQR